MPLVDVTFPLTVMEPPRYVTSLALVTAAPTVKSAVLPEVPTIRFPTVVEESVAGKVTAEAKEVSKGSKVNVPAVFTLNAAELELE